MAFDPKTAQLEGASGFDPMSAQLDETELLSGKGLKRLVTSIPETVSGTFADAEYGAHQELLDGMKVSLGKLTPGTPEYIAQQQKIAEQEQVTAEKLAKSKSIQAQISTEVPNPSLAMRAAMGVIPSIVSMAPSIVTRNPAPLAHQSAVGQFQASSYGEARREGADPQDAAAYANIAGPMEGITEWMPMGKLFQELGTEGTKQLLVKTLGREIASEEINTAVDNIAQNIAVHKDQTLGEFLGKWGEEATITALQAGMQTGIVAGPIAAANAVLGSPEAQKRRAARILASEIEAATRNVVTDDATYTPVQDSEHTKGVGKQYEYAAEEFRRTEISPDLEAQFGEKYFAKTEVTPFETTGDIQLDQQVVGFELVNNPKKAAEYVVANFKSLDAAGVSIPQVIADLVNTKKISAELGSRIIDRTTAEMQRVVNAFSTAAKQAREQFETQRQSFLDRAPIVDPKTSNILKDAGSWTAAAQEAELRANDPTNLQNNVPLTYNELVQFGVPPSAALYLTKAPVNEQAVLMQRHAEMLAEMVTTTPQPGKRRRTSPAVVGLFTRERDLAHSLRGQEDVDGKVVTFGPLKGQTVNDTFLNPEHQGAVNIINDGNTPAAVEKRIYSVMRRWAMQYMPNAHLIIHVGEGRSYALPVSENTMVIHIDRDHHGASLVSAMSHEFGHAMFFHQYYNSDGQVREALRQQWVRWLDENWNTMSGDYMKATFANQHYADYSPGKTLSNATGYLTARFKRGATTQNLEAADYVLNFYEWHASIMERMLAGNYADMQAPVRAFMRRAFNKLKEFFTKEHQQWSPDQTMQEWLALMKQRAVAERAANAQMEAQSAALNLGLTGVRPGEANLAPISPDNQRQFDPMTAQPLTEMPAPEFAQAVQKVTKLFNRVSPEHGKPVMESLVQFNEFWAKLLGTFQVLELNIQVPGAQQFLTALRNKFGYKSTWLRHANLLANDWENLGKVQAGAVSKLLLTEAESGEWYSRRIPDPNNPGHYIFILDAAKASKFGITEKGEEVYSRVRNMFMRALDAMEAQGVERIERQFADKPNDPQKATQLQELRNSYAQMRDKPYTPFSRFGKYYVKIKAQENGLFKDPTTGVFKYFNAGQTVYFETFETETERDLAVPKLRETYRNQKMLNPHFNTGKIHDIVYSTRNLPPQFVRQIAERLGLSEEQLREYNELVKDLAADSSFIKHMKRKMNVSGYSPDTLRGFADYFMRFANNYAKAKSAPEFEDAMRTMREYKRQLEATETDTTKLDELYNWMQRTFNYVMNPGNEWAELKSFVAAWYLGFNIPTAAQNLTQLPFWTLPYLSKRFGTGQALSAMKRALSDVTMSWKRLDTFSADEQAMLNHALEQGFIDESFATSIAQFAEGTALSRLSATATRHRLLNWYNHKALWLFQKAEEINRRTTLLATYRLNRQKAFAGDFDQQAFLKAREAVEKTQNEYALENRPEFMRGKLSVVFQFMHYVQNAIFRMTPWGDISWKRLLIMQLAVAGLMGLPFAEDIMNLAKFLARKFGIDFQPERELRQLLVELNVSPDWVLRGAASHAGPFDLSYRYSLGQVIPGAAAIGSNKNLADAVLEGVGDVGGAGMSILMNAMKAVASINGQDTGKTLQYIAPSFARYGLQALDAAEHGGVTGRNMAVLAATTPAETAGMAIGLQPRAKSVAMRRITLEIETRNYWMTRRGKALQNVYDAYQAQDREAIADAVRAIKEFNMEAAKVDRNLLISARTLRNSREARQRARVKQELYGSPYDNPQLTRDIQGEVPAE